MSRLPPLDYILAFEAAAKHQSFVGAAKDLNISETAIGRKVRLLEQHYGILFFLRSHKSIELTPQGQSFLQDISPALQILRETSRTLLGEDKKRTVVLAATHSVAALWLMPHLRKFNLKNKHLKITLIASDNDNECMSENINLSILHGTGSWPGYYSQFLFGETIFPVCSPRYLKENPEISDTQSLSKFNLIEVSNPQHKWMGWKGWFLKNKVSSENIELTTVFNSYPLSIQAAEDGLGIALGWGHLVGHLIEEGKLVRPTNGIDIRTDNGYYLLRLNNHKPSPECEVVESWLLQISEMRQRYKN